MTDALALVGVVATAPAFYLTIAAVLALLAARRAAIPGTARSQLTATATLVLMAAVTLRPLLPIG